MYQPVYPTFYPQFIPVPQYIPTQNNRMLPQQQNQFIPPYIPIPVPQNYIGPNTQGTQQPINNYYTESQLYTDTINSPLRSPGEKRNTSRMSSNYYKNLPIR